MLSVPVDLLPVDDSPVEKFPVDQRPQTGRARLAAVDSELSVVELAVEVVCKLLVE
jgi:hypothetical protein